MKKNVMIISGIATLFATMVTTLAYSEATINSLSEMTGLESNEIVELRDDGSTMMEIATSEGVEVEFKEIMLENRIERIDEKVEEGKLTPEEGAAAIEHIKVNAETCTGDESGEKLNLAVGGTKQARANRSGNNQ